MCPFKVPNETTLYYVSFYHLVEHKVSLYPMVVLLLMGFRFLLEVKGREKTYSTNKMELLLNLLHLANLGQILL